MARYRPRRFKVQQRVDLWARDRSNRPFLLGVIWRTVHEHDKQTVAEASLGRELHDKPRREFRIAEEWPIGSTVRPVLTARHKTARLNLSQS